MRTMTWTLAAVLLGSVGSVALAVDPAPKIDQDAARRFKAEGDGLIQRGKLKDAIGAYESAIKANPEWLVAHDALDAAYFQASKFDAVIEHQKLVTEKHADYANGFYSLAYAYRKAGKNAESVEAYQKFLKLRPTDADAYYGLGKAQAALDKKDDAIASLQSYIKLEKRQSEKNWVEKAKAMVKDLKKKGGKAPDEPADPNSPAERTAFGRSATLADQGDAQAKAGKWAEAYDSYLKASAADPNSTRAYDGIGEAGVRVKKHKDMVAMFRSATSDLPGYAAGYYYLGVALSEVGKRPEAIEALKRFTALQPTNPDGQYNYGLLLKDAGKKDDAVKALKAYLASENRTEADKAEQKKKAEAALKDLGAAPGPAAPAPAAPKK